MLEIKPFRALRFSEQAGESGSLCCPPYDIISEEERKGYLSRDEHNMVRLELPRGEHPYEDAGKTLKKWLQEGILRRDGQPGIYLYEEEFTVRGVRKSICGFVSLVRLREFSEGVVLPHEETLSKAKADRFELMKATMCNFSQIYSLYFDENGAVCSVLDVMRSGAPDTSFTDADGVTHRLWCVYDAALAATLAEHMAEKQAFIADGHHRYETALNFRRHLQEQGVVKDEAHPANYVMMLLVAMEDPGLVVLPTHRIVRGLVPFDKTRVLTGCAELFTTEEREGDPQPVLDAAYEAGKKSFVLYTGGKKWHLLTLRNPAALDTVLPGTSKAYRSLDVNVLHLLVLERVLGIDKENMANQKNLTYMRSAAEALSAVNSGEANCALLMNPTRVEEIADVAAAGEKMPQKSTYFYPKLITGLVMNEMTEH